MRSKKKSFITVNDLARELGISTSTVSRALRDHHDVKPETRQRVLDLAQRLNYQPNMLALGLLNQRSCTLGVVVPEIANPFFSAAISGMEAEALAQGYHLVICQSNEKLAQERAVIEQLVSMRVEGLIISVSAETTDAEYFSRLLRRNFPVVFFDRTAEKAFTHKVIIDDYQGAVQATEHLLAQGCRRIAHLAGPAHLGIAKSRLDGYRETLQKQGLAVEPSLIAPCQMNPESAQQAMTELLANEPDIDGVFAVNDRSAIGAITALKQAGRRIPADVCVVGFGNLWFDALIDPPLSSVDQPAQEMGRLAAQYLMMLTQDPEALTENGFMARIKVLPTHVIVRASSLRNPGSAAATA